ncbi:MAG: hypothetical protein GTN46_03040, partial [Gammaproteobacteria bacterium]|nr:hypothetical protein [Gammaproteobacteria bacterium]NIO62381.1 hypothetical protein [Gammaproteobacteria bacterium]NIQ20162.1 hypothetical protein [Gammaproteobacteria bacterium]NIT06327.1 hypothetical protein [Gammaproteobacteria bacterium]NIT40520.1 hypothetical protein [Gammaproteobacteria bacterium]
TVLTATGTNVGFQGTTTSTGGFDNITALTGSGGTDTLTGINAAADWTIQAGNDTYVSSGRTLTFDATTVENLTGNSGVDTFTVTTNHTGDLSGQGDNDVINLQGTAIVTGDLLGGAGDDLFDFDNTSRVVGNVDGGPAPTPNDAIDFSDYAAGQILTIAGTGTLHGQTGTIRDNPVTSPMISGTFDNIDSITGTGGLLNGPNVDTFWNITGIDQGTFGSSLATIGTTSFNNFQIQAGTADDTFVFQNNPNTRITNGIDGGLGTDTLAGSLAADTFDIDAGGGNVTITPTGAGVSTVLTSIESIDGTNATDDGISNIGDFGNDTFNIDNDWSGTLNGFDGDDTFTFADAVTVTGGLTGGAGTDIIDWNAYTTARTVTLTASDADGFSGTEASITGGFVTIDNIRGSTTGGQIDSITGLDAVATWTVNGGGTQYSTGGFNLAFSDFEDLSGGSQADTFNVTGAHTGDLDG